MAEGKRIIVIGGSGYLGQHLLDALARETGDPPYILAFTHHRSIPPPKLIEAISPVLSFRVELLSGEGFESISTAFGQPDVVVNCAAMSIPRACEVDPVTAMSTNMPTSLISWLSNCKGNNTLLIHLSTDQVYEGSKSFYKEEDETAPVNVYGKSKEAAEQFISEHCSNFAILRSSIIFGPQAISPVSKSLPIQWIDYSLSRGEEIEFFHDEFRCPIYVKDVVNAILALIEKWIAGSKKGNELGAENGRLEELGERLGAANGSKKRGTSGTNKNFYRMRRRRTTMEQRMKRLLRGGRGSEEQLGRRKTSIGCEDVERQWSVELERAATEQRTERAVMERRTQLVAMERKMEGCEASGSEAANVSLIPH